MDKKQLLESFFSTLSKMKRLMDQNSPVSAEERMATILQLQTLSFLSENPQSTPSQLASILCLSSSSAAQLVDRLVTSGWINRLHDENDRRVIHLDLTEEGKAQLATLKKMRSDKFDPIVKHISKADLEELVRIMNNISLALEEDMKGKFK